MREFFIPVVLQLAGVLIIIAEIILPSGGLLSLVAVGLFGELNQASEVTLVSLTEQWVLQHRAQRW